MTCKFKVSKCPYPEDEHDDMVTYGIPLAVRLPESVCVSLEATIRAWSYRRDLDDTIAITFNDVSI